MGGWDSAIEKIARDGSDSEKELAKEVLHLRRRNRILDKVLEIHGLDWFAEVDKVLKAYPQLTQRGPLPGGE